MKQIIFLISALLISINVSAQNSEIKTETFKVEGNCNMCKKRIEEAAYAKGVKRAEWNRATKELTVVYRTSKTTPETILNKVAQAGHNSEAAVAPEKAYKSLPKCCQYKTQVCND